MQELTKCLSYRRQNVSADEGNVFGKNRFCISNKTDSVEHTGKEHIDTMANFLLNESG
jgi:hypothetical protein